MGRKAIDAPRFTDLVRERNGGRSRNRYEITDEGRQALREWLGEPSSPPRIELEPCLRVLFADQGDHTTLEQLLAVDEKDLLVLHDVGPRAVRILREEAQNR